jgi:hypothetical protein
MTRPRAADDFAVIRARIEQLRRERTRMSAEPDPMPLGPAPYPAWRTEARRRRARLSASRDPADPVADVTRPQSHL